MPDGEVAPTGKPIRFDACHFFRFNADGKVVEDHRYYDLAGWLVQLGITS